MFCPNCKSNVKEGAKFCPRCGAKLAASFQADAKENGLLNKETGKPLRQRRGILFLIFGIAVASVIGIGVLLSGWGKSSPSGDAPVLVGEKEETKEPESERMESNRDDTLPEAEDQGDGGEPGTEEETGAEDAAPEEEPLLAEKYPEYVDILVEYYLGYRGIADTVPISLSSSGLVNTFSMGWNPEESRYEYYYVLRDLDEDEIPELCVASRYKYTEDSWMAEGMYSCADGLKDWLDRDDWEDVYDEMFLKDMVVRHDENRLTGYYQLRAGEGLVEAACADYRENRVNGQTVSDEEWMEAARLYDQPCEKEDWTLITEEELERLGAEGPFSLVPEDPVPTGREGISPETVYRISSPNSEKGCFIKEKWLWSRESFDKSLKANEAWNELYTALCGDWRVDTCMIMPEYNEFTASLVLEGSSEGWGLCINLDEGTIYTSP